MSKYKAVIVGAGRMAGTIDDEMSDYRYFTCPYSHAAGYALVPEVELVAVADLQADKVAALQARYGIPRGYTDYREMIQTERPDIVSITTPAATHAEATIFAAEHGVRGIYCEKPLACSLAEADAMVAAVETHGVKFNMGTLRRWCDGTEAAKRLLATGELGAVQTVISYSVGGLLHSASHFIDLLLYFADDSPAEWVQGTVLHEGFDPAAPRADEDLSAVAHIHFANGVWGHLLNTPLWAQHEIICSEGVLRTRNDCSDWQMWKTRQWGRAREWVQVPFPRYTRHSSTLRLIRDLVQAMDTDAQTMQGIRTAAQTMEIAIGAVESHRQGGARVSLPLADRSYWMCSY